MPFGQAATQTNLSVLTQHYYRGNGQSSSATAANLIASDSNLTNCLGLLNSGANSIGVPFRIGECNSYFNGGAPGVSNAYASSLWILDFLFNCAQGGAPGLTFMAADTRTAIRRSPTTPAQLSRRAPCFME